jgi:transcriptional regulator with XRE-family HTH domain
MSTLYKQIGERLKIRRIALSLTQQDLADAISVKRTTITNTEAGRQCLPLERLYALCEYLEISIHSVIPDNDLPEKTETMTIDGQIRTLSPKVAAAIRSAYSG